MLEQGLLAALRHCDKKHDIAHTNLVCVSAAGGDTILCLKSAI